MPTEARLAHRRSRTGAILGRKRKKLLAQSRSAVAKAQAQAQQGSNVNVATAATKLRGELASLRRDIEAEQGAGPRAAARALADLEHSLAAMVKATQSNDSQQAMADLKSGYQALISAKHAAKQAGHDWAL